MGMVFTIFEGRGRWSGVNLKRFINLHAIIYLMMNCSHCNQVCIKAGKQKSGVQKFLCRTCRKYQQAHYVRNAWRPNTGELVVLLVREGLSMRGIARILSISLSTVLVKIRKVAAGISKPSRSVRKHVYEIDELWTFIGRKTDEAWVMYAFDRTSKEVMDFRVGARTKENLRALTDLVIHEDPSRICTDGLKVYPTLITPEIHKVGSVHTRHIERHNLNLRTHLKRLSRKTICFSKSLAMLEACLRIYFWSRTSCQPGSHICLLP